MSPRDTVARVLERLVAVLSAVILLMSLTAIASMIVIQHEVRETTRTITPLLEASTAARIEANEAQTSYRAYLLTEDSDFLQRYRTSRKDFEREAETLQTSGRRGVIDEEQAQAFLDAGKRWFEATDEAVADSDVSGEQRARRTAGLFDRVVEEHGNLVVEIGQAQRERQDRYGTAMNAAIALMGLATLLAILVTVHQSRRALSRLAHPLQALQRIVTGHERGAVGERADVSRGAEEVVALASAFNSLAESNAAMQREREHRLHLYRVTGRVAGLLTTRDRGWDRACAEIGEGLGADMVSFHRVTSGRLEVLGAWGSSGSAQGLVLPDEELPALTSALEESGHLQAARATDITAGFPPGMARLAEELSLEGWLVHPMSVGGETVGVVSVATLQPHEWDEPEVHALERVSEYGAHTLVEQRYVASLEELDQQKSDFMATTSHELRTPLTSIAGYLELLEDGDYGELTGPQSRALEVVARNVGRLRYLIDDLLLLNRLDSGQARTQRRVHDIRDSVSRVAEELGPVAAAAEVDLVLSQPEEPGLVRVDPGQIERALGNLVSNAVKFTPAGGQVQLETIAQEGEVQVRCADTGIGIPAADQERLFTRFFRASNAQEDQVPGTGLGLVIVQTIAEIHGGGVELSSVEGEGTIITLTLPALSSSPEQ